MKGQGTRALLAWLALATSGCSMMLVSPSAQKDLNVASCTDDYLWPVVDTLAGVAAASATIYAASRSYANEPRDSLGREDAVVGYGVTSVFFAGSAVAGFSRVHACREAKAIAGPPAGPALSLAR